MSTVSCLPKPRETTILGDREISYDDVELEWVGEFDIRVGTVSYTHLRAHETLR